MITVPQAFALAVQHHQAGRLADAEALGRKILAVQPHHAGALQLLGVIAHQTGRPDLATEWLGQAIALNPSNPGAYFQLGKVYRTLGRPDEAIASYRQALHFSPDRAEVHYHLGNILAVRNRLDEAIAAYHRALELKPDYAEAQDGLGNALSDRGQLDDAIAAYRRALALQPDIPVFHNNLGIALTAQGRLDEAVAAFRGALELRRDLAEVHNNLGIALGGLGQLDAAITAYRQALQLKPDYPEAHNNLGNALTDRGQLEEATDAYRRALQLRPGYPEAHNNLGNALRERGQLEEAIAACRRALELKPDYPEAHNNLGNALRDNGRLDEAAAAYRRALEFKPDLPDLHINLGNVLKDQGQLDEALSAYRRALQLKPERAEVHSNLIYTLQFHPGYDAGQIAEEQRRWNQRFGDPWGRLARPHRRDRDPERRLRVGYVSADFRDHVVGRNLVPLFRHHDRVNFETICYAGVLRPDGVTEEIRRHTDRWRSTVGVADEAFAEMIRQDAVDILVDLAQHMAGNRLPVFARQLAPVQVSFAGYPAGTGVEAIPYRISDGRLEADASEMGDGRSKFGCKCAPDLPSPNSELRTPISHLLPAERVILLESFWCYDPCGIEMAVSASPAQASGRVTFGSLNNFCKINDGVLEVWARVLGQAPDSRLVLLSPCGSHRQRTGDFLERQGIAANRIEFVEPRPRREYLELYHRLDVVLDPFPYGGHTTSLDALWMGVPVVSLAGGTPVSRAGLSILSNLGRPELVGRSEEDYVRIAVELAGDIARLAELRATLRPRLEASVLMDAPRFARGVETAFRTLWRQWCATEKP